MIMFMVASAMIFGRFIAISRLPFELANWVSALNIHPFLVMVFIILVYLVLGCFIDALALILLTVPIFYPVVVNVLGRDPIWFGVIIALVVATGVITPPVGMNVFVVKGVARDVSLETIFKGVWPFLIAALVCVLYFNCISPNSHIFTGIVIIKAKTFYKAKSSIICFAENCGNYLAKRLRICKLAPGPFIKLASLKQ